MNGFGGIPHPNIDDILESVEEQSKQNAQNLLPGFTQQAIAATNAGLHNARGDLESWLGELAAGEISVDEFADCVRDQKALLRMDILKEEGVSQANLDVYTSGVIDILIKTALAALKI